MALETLSEPDGPTVTLNRSLLCLVNGPGRWSGHDVLDEHSDAAGILLVEGYSI
jgi:hypothetical protein